MALWGALILAALAIVDVFWPKQSSEEKPDAPQVQVTFLSFEDLEGWSEGTQAEALGAIALSCKRMFRSEALGDTDPPAEPRLEGWTARSLKAAMLKKGGWLEACGSIDTLMATGENADHTIARDFFETHFQPVLIRADDEEPKFTGYFEPTYEARITPEGLFTAPVLTPPDDLIQVQLGAFDPDLAGKRVAGRVKGNRLVPYADHEGIIDEVPPGREPLGYLNPNDLLFMQIQGSGRLAFDDGQVERVGYAAQNGHKYVPVGRTLVNEGHMALSNVTMQSIKDWLTKAPGEDAAAIRYSNPSYVFFRPLTDLPDPNLGPLGAQSVQLTPHRSLAVDHRYYVYGSPVWVETEATERNAAIRRLFIAQDTGGAIRGTQRGDVFFGAGEAAADAAGTMNAPGEMIILLPKALFIEKTDEPS